MGVRPEVLPFLIGVWVLAALLGVVLRALGVRGRRALVAAAVVAVLLAGYMLYFFRDPPRTAPADPAVAVAGADGTVMAVVEVAEPRYLQTNAVRVSIFLSLFDVHVNRAPIAGRIAALDYHPGRRLFTFQEKSSEVNQHNSIFIQGRDTRCLVNQVVGPVARRVVYWLTLDQPVAKGDSIGMMKFGSRLDMYFPAGDVTVVVKRGDKVRAGETVVATLKPGEAP
jgi:phosphatidylserine decarboxylase